MKTRTKLIKSIIALCGTLATTSAWAQVVTYTWTNQSPANTGAPGDLGTSINWSPNGIANPVAGPDLDTGTIYGDELLWDGQTTGDVLATANQNQTAFSAGTPSGLRVRLSSNQTNAVNIRAVIAGPTAGTRLNSITIEEGAGAFSLGDATTLNCLDLLFGATNPQTHTWRNNSTNPVTIHPSVRHRLGAGGAHIFDIGGPGNWIINNYWRNANGAATLITKSGTGNLYWTGTNIPAALTGTGPISTPVTINDGKLFLRSFDLLGNQTININGGRLVYDAPVGSGLLSGNINGAGLVEITNGTVTFSGVNSFSGGVILSGGTLYVNRAENVGINGPLGNGGTIFLNGGTLGYGANNSFDYSSRFDTTAVVAYNFDTAGQNVTFATGLGFAGAPLNKSGSGTLTLAGASTYTGATTVTGGRLVFQGSKSGTGNITVADNAALGVTATGTQVAPSVLTLGTSAGVTLEFNNVNSTTTAPLAAGTISAAGTVTININSGNFTTIGLVYPLFSWTSGSAPAVTLGVINGAAGTLSTNGNTIRLTITETPYVWTGLTSDVWNLATPNNWVQSGTPQTFVNNVLAVFDDSSTVTNVAISGLVQPRSLTFNNSVNAYAITNSVGNNIAGTNSVTKNGSGTLMLPGGANTYTGVTAVNGGVLEVAALANGGVASDIGAATSAAGNLVLNGGTLRYTGDGGTVDRLFSVGTSGGTLEQAGTGLNALLLTNTGTVGLVGSGPRTLNLTGTDVNTNLLAARIVDSAGGATSLGKNGPGLWVLTGTNAYTGATTIGDGVLQIGADGPSGVLGSGNILNNGALDFRRTGTLTVSSAISGSGEVTNSGTGTVILSANNSYSGGTFITAGTLQVGNGGASGSLNPTALIQNDSLLIFNTSGAFDYQAGGLIAGTGNVIVRGGGIIRVYGANSYTGWTQIDANSTFQPTKGNTGQLLSSVVTNNGTLRFVAQDPRPAYVGNIYGTGRVQMGGNNFNAGTINLAGTNFYTGGTFIGSGEIIFGDGFTPGAGAFLGNVTFVNNFDTADDNLKAVTFNRPDDFTYSGNIVTSFSGAQNNQGIVRQTGSGVLTLTGNNTYGSGTEITAGTVVVGNGGTTGSLGTGPITHNGTLLVFNRSDNLTVSGAVSGGGPIVKLGAGTLTMASTNYTAYFGTLTVSNGTLALASSSLANTTNAFAGSLEVNGGTLIVGGIPTVTALEIQGLLNFNGGTIYATLNTSLPLSNTLFTVASSINYTAGTLRLINAGPQLVVGQKFTLFSQPVTGGAGMTIVTPGFTVQNDLATDGSVTVTAVLPPPTISSTVTGNQLSLSWPAAWVGGVHLQAQTNTLSVGLSNNWVTIPGTELSNTYLTTINPNNRAVFYRLINP